jgi:hypothetical protein
LRRSGDYCGVKEYGIRLLNNPEVLDMLNLEGDLTDVLVGDGDLIDAVAASLGPEGPHADQSHRLVDWVNRTQDALVPDLHGRDDRKS